MSKLIERAKQIKSELNLTQLREAGIRRHREEYEYIVTYPAIPAMSPITQEDIFSGESKEREVQFYTHIPFCTGKCTYCGRFQKFPRQSRQTVDSYIDYLEKEMEIMNSIPELEKIKVGSLYIGGGTPTYLSSKQLIRVIKNLTSQLDILKEREFTVEGSPETINREKLETILENGVNRISMGVQSYHNDVLKLCGRRHTAERARKISKLIREVGFNNFNIDLIPGLPLQTLKKWEENLKATVDSGATCVTAYPLYVGPGCEMVKLPDNMFPSEGESLLMEIMTKEFFKDLGFKEDPVHFFASPGIVSQAQNIKKWKGSEVTGLGISTYNFMNNVQYHNHFGIGRYKTSIDSGRLPIWIGKKLDTKEQISRLMVLGMKRGKINSELFTSKWGPTPEEIFPEIMGKLKDLGLIEIDYPETKLTYLGKLFSEEVAIQFFTDKTRKAYEKVGAKYAGYFTANLPDY